MDNFCNRGCSTGSPGRLSDFPAIVTTNGSFQVDFTKQLSMVNKHHILTTWGKTPKIQ